MTRWTVSLGASATVSVEAETEAQAREAAEKTLEAVGIDKLSVKDVSHYSVDVSVMRDE